MKTNILFSAALCLMLLCTACGTASSSSHDPFAVFDDAVSGSSSGSASPAPDSVSASAESTSPAPGSSSSRLPAGQICFISQPVIQTDGSIGQKGVITLYAPEDWTYDNYITFSRGDVKIAEVPALWQAGSGSTPFTDAMTAPYQDDEGYPEGFGLLASEDTTRNGHMLRLLHLKIWMPDAEAPSWMHCAFYETDGHVVQVHLYTAEEWGGADSEALLAMLDSAELAFAESGAQE